MSRFLSTIPTNHGFVNLGNVEAYPTGGSGPTAFGPTSYFGSDPRPPEVGSRGYTGTLRITHKEGCDYTCCNPLHLRIMGVKLENPKKIGEINLQLRKGKTIYDHARNNREKSDM